MWKWVIHWIKASILEIKPIDKNFLSIQNKVELFRPNCEWIQNHVCSPYSYKDVMIWLDNMPVNLRVFL